MLPHGEFVEVHEPISAERKFVLTSHEQPVALSSADEDASGVAVRGRLRNKIRARWSAANAEQVPAATKAELEHGGHH